MMLLIQASSFKAPPSLLLVTSATCAQREMTPFYMICFIFVNLEELRDLIVPETNKEPITETVVINPGNTAQTISDPALCCGSWVVAKDIFYHLYNTQCMRIVVNCDSALNQKASLN